MITVTIDGFDQAMRWIDPRVITPAAKISIKEAAAAAKTKTSEEITKRWNIKRRDLDRKFAVKSSSGGMSRTLIIQGDPIGLSYFGAREVRRTGQGVVTRTRGKDGKMVSKVNRRSKQSTSYLVVEIHKGKRTFLPNAWLANVKAFAGSTKGGKSGDTLYGDSRARVLARIGKSRMAIKSDKSISVPSMFKQAGIAGTVEVRAADVLNQRFSHHIDRLRQR